MEDIDTLDKLTRVVTNSSLCGLGQTCANPVATTLRYFRDEYEAHIKDHRCPAGVCPALLVYQILEEKCTGCGACLRACPSGAISGEKKEPHKIDLDLCIKCGACIQKCKFDAIIKA
jgi:NADH-quinone oxidoreductase subunit F